TLIVGLTASLLVALVFNPTLCASFMKGPARTGRHDPGPADAARHDRRDARPGRGLPAYEGLLLWLLEPARDLGGAGWFLRNWLLLSVFGVALSVGIGLALVAFTVPSLTARALAVAAIVVPIGGAAFVLQVVVWAAWTPL